MLATEWNFVSKSINRCSFVQNALGEWLKTNRSFCFVVVIGNNFSIQVIPDFLSNFSVAVEVLFLFLSPSDFWLSLNFLLFTNNSSASLDFLFCDDFSFLSGLFSSSFCLLRPDGDFFFSTSRLDPGFGLTSFVSLSPFSESVKIKIYVHKQLIISFQFPLASKKVRFLAQNIIKIEINNIITSFLFGFGQATQPNGPGSLHF